MLSFKVDKTEIVDVAFSEYIQLKKNSVIPRTKFNIIFYRSLDQMKY